MSAHTQRSAQPQGLGFTSGQFAQHSRQGNRAAGQEPHCGPCTYMVNGRITYCKILRNLKLQFHPYFASFSPSTFCTASRTEAPSSPSYSETLYGLQMPSTPLSPSTPSKPSPEPPKGELAWIERIRQRAAIAARGSGALRLGIGDDCAILSPARPRDRRHHRHVT